MPIPVLHAVHFGLEALLAAAVAVLFRLLARQRARLTALETETGVMRKRHDAANAGFHIRLLQVEKGSRSAAAAAAGGPGVPPSAPAGAPPPAAVLADPSRLNRGERDLMQKIRGLTRAPHPSS